MKIGTEVVIKEAGYNRSVVAGKTGIVSRIQLDSIDEDGTVNCVYAVRVNGVESFWYYKEELQCLLESTV